MQTSIHPAAAKLRKAAILVSSLDAQTADQILEQMPEEQAGQVRRMMVELGDVDPREQQRVIDEFFRHGPARPAPAVDDSLGGVELDPDLARRLGQASRPAPRRFGQDADEQAAGEPPFRFLREAHTARITPFLAGEHPQTIALVISHLPPERAAGVLAALDGELQAEVLRRLTDLEETDPEIMREVERGLESKILEQARSERRRAAGLSAAAGILAAAEPAAKRTLLANLARHDRPLAGKLRPQPPAFDFDDLERLDDAALSRVFAAADTELTTLALAGASAALVERLLAPLSPVERRQFNRLTENLGPLRLSDVEEAQRQIAELARQLAWQGELELPDRAPLISHRQVVDAYRH
ncbi:MAG TPA: FliG C-terminal domain-containing protein [Pirellulales bacterium]|nr:FliG C-terminal domain-containing protein [Pirellulales bacterium]